MQLGHSKHVFTVLWITEKTACLSISYMQIMQKDLEKELENKCTKREVQLYIPCSDLRIGQLVVVGFAWDFVFLSESDVN